MDINLSIIICTYNPVESILRRALTDLEKACKKVLSGSYEILIIDNNSSVPLAEQNYISSFITRSSNARLIVEKKQGLTPARLRGIEESKGDLLLYIDDDNFIKPDFIEKGLEISGLHSHIGAWSGQVHLEFEKKPEAWTEQYYGLLVHRVFEKDYWSNLPFLPETMPCGAGLFVRRQVAEYYLRLHKDGKRNIQLDRSENSLFSGGDNDLAACACDLGMGVGLFRDLVLDHYIPAQRTELNYLVRLAEGIAASDVVLKSFRHRYPGSLTLKNRIANSLRLVFKSKHAKMFHKAVLRGESIGKSIYLKNSTLPKQP